MLRSTITCIALTLGTLTACASCDGSGSGGDGGSAGSNPAACPETEPSFYDSDTCVEAVTCHYVREDGCPTVQTCTPDEGWAFYNAPSDGVSCEEYGKKCVYSGPDCGAQIRTAVCTGGVWHVTVEYPDETCI